MNDIKAYRLDIVIINDYNGFLNKLVFKFAKKSGFPFSIYNLILSKELRYHLTDEELRLLKECHSIYVNALNNDDWELLSKLCKTNLSYEDIKHKCLIVDNFDENPFIKEHWQESFPHYNDKVKL